MNKSEKLIVALLGLLLLGSLWHSNKQQTAYREAMREYVAAHPDYTNALAQAAAAQTAAATNAAAAEPVLTTGPGVADEAADAAEADPATGEPERTLSVSNAVLDLVFTSKGGALAAATLREYDRSLDPAAGPVSFDFSASPSLALEDLPGLGVKADFSLEEAEGAVRMRAAAPSGLALERTVALTNGYHLAVTDVFRNEGAAAAALPPFRVALGPIAPLGDAAGGLGAAGPAEGVDVRARDGRGAPKTLEQNLALPLVKGGSRSFAQMFGAAGGGGCMGGCSAATVAPTAPREATDAFSIEGGSIDWVAVRERFFVQILTPGLPARGVETRVRRKATAAGAPLAIESLGAALSFPEAALAPGEEAVRTYSLYLGPRKMDELRKESRAHLDVMRFGTWSWFCRGLLDLLNFIHRFVPNYGWSIVVLTFLVRLLLLPLSRKSQQGMKKMSELQPKIQEINEKYKDEPQKRQAETMRLWQENHVNPLASCLPMLIQLPIFIALFTVLRSSIELRFAPWLWVADLSAPENCFRDALGFGVNFLPIAMAATMTLQSLLTPSAGDPKQQRMMAIMMPVMMLVMFYSMASALCLYWSVSQALAIFGLWWARRAGAKQRAARGPVTLADGTVVTPPPRRV